MIDEKKEIVLDSSALIVLIKKKPGYEKVAKALPYSIMSSISVAEITNYLHKKKSVPLEKIEYSITNLINTIVDFDSTQAFNCNTASLSDCSLAERASINLAITRNASFLTANQTLSNLKLGIDIEFLKEN